MLILPKIIFVSLLLLVNNLAEAAKKVDEIADFVDLIDQSITNTVVKNAASNDYSKTNRRATYLAKLQKANELERMKEFHENKTVFKKNVANNLSSKMLRAKRPTTDSKSSERNEVQKEVRDTRMNNNVQKVAREKFRAKASKKINSNDKIESVAHSRKALPSKTNNLEDDEKSTDLSRRRRVSSQRSRINGRGRKYKYGRQQY
jgi:uncharacterized lipoprotein YajG